MLVQLLGLRGRIGRIKWATVMLLLVGLYLLEGQVLLPAVLPDYPKSTELQILSQQLMDITFHKYLGSVPLAICQVLQNWLFVTACVQRYHDRGMSGTLVLFLYFPHFTFLLASYMLAQGADLDFWTTPMIGSHFMGYIVFVWMFFSLGLKPGDDVANEYGPPSGEQSVRAAASFVSQFDQTDIDTRYQGNSSPVQFNVYSNGQRVFGRR